MENSHRSSLDSRIRAAAFEWLAEQVDLHGDALPRSVLEKGFDYAGERIPLVAPNGIFKPRLMELPLSITTVAGGPYSDAFGIDGTLQYKYRGENPNHRDNVGARELLRRRVPLVYFYGLSPGRYLAVWPAYIVGDDPKALTFSVEVDDRLAIKPENQSSAEANIEDGSSPIRRGYVTTLTRRRIHQQAFRERVLAAYRQQCALCRLRHEALLDAAHILPDSDPEGEPVTSNGLALCKIHHAAFDKHFLAIRPDYRIEIRADLLEETDGPMLRHGLQGIHGQEIWVPRSAELKPSVAALEQRYRRFLEVTSR